MEIVEGLLVWTNNLVTARVIRRGTYPEMDGSFWWDTTDGLMNGERMSTRHPFTGEIAR